MTTPPLPNPPRSIRIVPTKRRVQRDAAPAVSSLFAIERSRPPVPVPAREGDGDA